MRLNARHQLIYAVFCAVDCTKFYISRFAAELIKVNTATSFISFNKIVQLTAQKIITGLSAGYYYSKSALKYKIPNEF